MRILNGLFAAAFCCLFVAVVRSSAADINNGAKKNDPQSFVETQRIRIPESEARWALTGYGQERFKERILENLKNVPGPRDLYGYYKRGELEIRFSGKLGSSTTAVYDSFHRTDAIMLSRKHVEKTMRFLLSEGYSEDRAEDIAGRLWVSRVAHETAHAADQRILKDKTNLKFIPRNIESEYHAMAVEARFSEYAIEGLDEELVLGTQLGRIQKGVLRCWSMGSVACKRWIRSIYDEYFSVRDKDVSAEIEFYTEKARKANDRLRIAQKQHSSPYTIGRLKREKQCYGEAVRFWSSADLKDIAACYYDQKLLKQD
ncbi:hypothetical protein ACFL6Y_10880 [Elusimicrobiota bacterium]